jgi:PAS domain S-box-containing protein
VTSPLRILLLEDNPNDAELVQELLGGEQLVCDVTCVQTRAEFAAALKAGDVDLILADYKLPSFDGISALKIAMSERPDLPFIFVSGTLGEELAIEALKIGATDYVLKTRLSRLVPSVQRALREAQGRAERKKAEEALRRSEMYLAEAQRLSHTGSFGWDVPSGHIYWSEETYRIFECDPATMPTLQFIVDRTHPDDRPHVREILDRASIERRGFTAEHRLVMADGTVKYVRAVAHPSAGEHPESLVLIGAVIDITERKRSEETLREQANLLDLTHDAIFVRDMMGVTTYWNRGAEALYGWRAEEARGKIASDLLKTIFPVSSERIAAELRSSGYWEGELVHTKSDGTQVAVASRWSLQRNAQGAPVAVLETNNDVSHRKRAEEERERLRQRETDLAHMNRVSMMGELAASVAHEIKQPVAAAVMHASACMEWLRRGTPAALEEARNAASKMIDTAMRAAAIIDRIGSLYRRGTPQRGSVDLNEIVREMTALLGDIARRNAISIRTELDLALPTATADRVQLQQVLMNLMLNGVEAMKDMGGELTVRSGRTEEDELLISVSDSGVGLPSDDAERIFGPFFTTKPQGTGMGLSISRRIIEAHGGRLWASPNNTRGAVLQFTLPGEATGSSP